eukprot:618606-Amphidinium_carterae.1
MAHEPRDEVERLLCTKGLRLCEVLKTGVLFNYVDTVSHVGHYGVLITNMAIVPEWPTRWT